uniref:Uncharacterized protein n=1 Tax=Anguilla anguilla TaxID=7936 RepID=A0A0E9QVA2_ANGAN
MCSMKEARYVEAWRGLSAQFNSKPSSSDSFTCIQNLEAYTLWIVVFS